MQSFASFSDNLRKKILKAYDEKEVIAFAIKKGIGIEVKKDAISLRDTVLSVRVTGVVKQELLSKTKEIQRLLNGAGISITEIR